MASFKHIVFVVKKKKNWCKIIVMYSCISFQPNGTLEGMPLIYSTFFQHPVCAEITAGGLQWRCQTDDLVFGRRESLDLA